MTKKTTKRHGARGFAQDLANVLFGGDGPAEHDWRSDGSMKAVVHIPAHSVPSRVTDLFETARRGLDNLDYNTSGAEMSAVFRSDGTATMNVVLQPKTEGESDA